MAAHTYQTYTDVEALGARREKIQFTISTSETYVPAMALDESMPRRFQPLAMDSPLSTEQFAIWPPTPRNPDSKPIIDEAENYSCTATEDVHGTATASPWNSTLSLDSHPSDISINEAEMSRSYSASLAEAVDCNNWSQPRNDYNTMLVSDTPELSSSYGSYGSSYTSASGAFPVFNAFTSTTPMLSLSLDTTNVPRRISDANSLSSIDGNNSSANTEFSRFDDFSGYDSSSLLGYKTMDAWSTSTTPLSPRISPVRRFSRSSSRGPRGSPSPSRSHRVSPYDKTQRWSTGNSYSNTSLNNLDPVPRKPAAHSYQSSPICGSTNLSNLPQPKYPLPSQIPFAQSNNVYSLYSQPDASHLMSYTHGYLPHHQHDFGIHPSPYTEYSEKPNLYGALAEEQIPPPPEDLNPEDPEMKPHEQDLRFEGDLYTPRWVRGHGNKREGWCGICKPGRWLVLKNSAFWYDKSFTHGVSAATGSSFHEPRDMRRMDGNPDVWEGLCHSCDEWVPLVSNKKKGTTWFRHAYKCHTHNKVKDSKKRRDNNPKQADVSLKGTGTIKAEVDHGLIPCNRS